MLVLQTPVAATSFRIFLWDIPAAPVLVGQAKAPAPPFLHEVSRSAPGLRRLARLIGRSRVYDVSMTKPTGWGWVILAGLLSTAPSFAQTLNNQNLNGKYFFRHVSLGTNSPSPASLDALTLMGTITFNGSGRYDYIGQALIGHGAVAVSQTGSGAYSLDQSGFVSLDSPLRAGAKINARFAAEAVIGSSTESTDSEEPRPGRERE